MSGKDPKVPLHRQISPILNKLCEDSATQSREVLIQRIREIKSRREVLLEKIRRLNESQLADTSFSQQPSSASSSSLSRLSLSSSSSSSSSSSLLSPSSFPLVSSSSLPSPRITISALGVTNAAPVLALIKPRRGSKVTTDPLHSLTSVTRHRGEDTHNRQVSPIISSSAETGSAQLRVLISSPTRGKDGASTLVCKRQHEIDSPNHRRFREDKSRNDFTNASTATSRVASADPDALLLDRPSYIRQFPSTERSHVDFEDQNELPQQRAVSQDEFKRIGNIIGQSISAKTRANTYDRYVEGWVKFISDTWGYTGCAWLISILCRLGHQQRYSGFAITIYPKWR